MLNNKIVFSKLFFVLSFFSLVFSMEKKTNTEKKNNDEQVEPIAKRTRSLTKKAILEKQKKAIELFAEKKGITKKEAVEKIKKIQNFYKEKIKGIQYTRAEELIIENCNDLKNAIKNKIDFTKLKRLRISLSKKIIEKKDKEGTEKSTDKLERSYLIDLIKIYQIVGDSVNVEKIEIDLSNNSLTDGDIEKFSEVLNSNKNPHLDKIQRIEINIANNNFTSSANIGNFLFSLFLHNSKSNKIFSLNISNNTVKGKVILDILKNLEGKGIRFADLNFAKTGISDSFVSNVNKENLVPQIMHQIVFLIDRGMTSFGINLKENDIKDIKKISRIFLFKVPKIERLKIGLELGHVGMYQLFQAIGSMENLQDLHLDLAFEKSTWKKYGDQIKILGTQSFLPCVTMLSSTLGGYSVSKYFSKYFSVVDIYDYFFGENTSEKEKKSLWLTFHMDKFFNDLTKNFGFGVSKEEGFYGYLDTIKKNLQAATYLSARAVQKKIGREIGKQIANSQTLEKLIQIVSLAATETIEGGTSTASAIAVAIPLIGGFLSGAIQIGGNVLKGGTSLSIKTMSASLVFLLPYYFAKWGDDVDTSQAFNETKTILGKISVMTGDNELSSDSNVWVFLDIFKKIMETFSGKIFEIFQGAGNLAGETLVVGTQVVDKAVDLTTEKDSYAKKTKDIIYSTGGFISDVWSYAMGALESKKEFVGHGKAEDDKRKEEEVKKRTMFETIAGDYVGNIMGEWTGKMIGKTFEGLIGDDLIKDIIKNSTLESFAKYMADLKKLKCLHITLGLNSLVTDDGIKQLKEYIENIASLERFYFKIGKPVGQDSKYDDEFKNIKSNEYRCVF